MQDLLRSWRFTDVDSSVKMQEKRWTVIYSCCKFPLGYFCCDNFAAMRDEITPCVMCDV
jgi:hypothetical protein